MAKFSKVLKSIIINYGLGLLFLGGTVMWASAAPPATKYAPGETLDPTCSPGGANCTVTAPASSGANSDITSISGLTTALNIAYGGTGSTTGSITGSGALTFTSGADTNVTLTPQGTGKVVLDGLNWPTADGAANTYLGTDAGGNLSFTEPSGIMYSVGALYVTTPAATTITVQGTYYKAAGTTATTNLIKWDANSTNNRLRYTGTRTVHAHIAATISMTAGNNNQILGFRVVRNGDPAATDAVASSAIRKIATGADIGSTALHADFMMNTNDYIEVWVTNQTSTATVTLENLYFFVLAQPVA
jgi:hypothetical protein